MKTVLMEQIGRPDQVFGPKQIEKIKEQSNLIGENISREALVKLSETEVIFGTWGMPELTEEEMASLPNLKAVFYAAGAVRYFGRPLLERGIRLFSAWKYNAIPVAEFTVAQMILASKSFFRNVHEYRHQPNEDGYHKAYKGLGLYDIRIAILGGGAIGQLVMEMLRNFQVEVVYVASRESKRQISLEEAFKTCYIVSNHLPNREDNVNIITEDMLMSIPEGGTFINTGRGAQVDEEGLTRVMKARPDLTALLDVTDPEPVENSELIALPNVHIATHISGSVNNELNRMSDKMIEEFLAWKDGQPTDNYVDWDRFNAMA